MRLAVTVLVSVWACVYTGSLSRALWQQRNYRGGAGAAVLALLVLVAPVLVEIYRRWR